MKVSWEQLRPKVQVYRDWVLCPYSDKEVLRKGVGTASRKWIKGKLIRDEEQNYFGVDMLVIRRRKDCEIRRREEAKSVSSPFRREIGSYIRSFSRPWRKDI